MDDKPTTHEWRAHALRIAPLFDGVDYYRAVRDALINAHHHVLILGWEIHSEIDLLRGDEAEDPPHPRWPVRFADLLVALVEDRPQLRVDLLVWEGASLFALERQHLPRMKRPWNTHPRLRLVWDRTPPRLASHHQKVVTIDDRLAFVGGMDLTKSRWDTHEHRPRDERRRNPGLVPSHADPYHDAMLALDGECARTLADWARERWRRATGETLEPPTHDDDHDPWPDTLEPLLTRRDVELALTQPDHRGHEEKRQVEAAFLEQIAGAQRHIFIETQYLASDTITDALCERLREDDPPEIVLIMPAGCPGRLQSLTMDAKRDELLERLRGPDHEGRFRAWWPTLAGGDTDDVFERSVYVHAKVMIVDDRLLRIGSANLNNRSMGLDTELDATVDGAGDEEATDAIARTRRRLLAWMLGVTPDDVERAEREHSRMIPAIESLIGGERTLHSFEHNAPARLPASELTFALADPDRPLSDADTQRALDALAKHTRARARLRLASNIAIGFVRRWKGPILFALVLVALALAWRYTPLHELAQRERLREMLDAIASSPLGAIGVGGLFALLASFGAPVTILIAIVGALFPAPIALTINTVAVLASACPAFAIGRAFPGLVKERAGEGRLDRLRTRLQRNALVGVAVVRNLPVAPFAIANGALGVVGVRWAPYLLGTLIGMAPGIVLITLLGDRFTEMLRNPSAANIALLAGIVVVMIALAWGAQRLSPTRTDAPEED